MNSSVLSNKLLAMYYMLEAALSTIIRYRESVSELKTRTGFSPKQRDFPLRKDLEGTVGVRK